MDFTPSSSADDAMFAAARRGDTAALERMLDEHPERLYVRAEPYGSTLLHTAATHLDTVNLLLERGLDPNVRERGDNTYAMHWAAAAGCLDVVRRLADAGGDVVGQGDDHALGVIGWATCWEGCDDDAHRAVADFLISRGAQHHIFSAIALNLGDEVRRIVTQDPSQLSRRQSHNENFRLPLHFAVANHRAEMVALLIELGANPLSEDSFGYPAIAYSTSTDIDPPVMKAILMHRDRFSLTAAVALHDWDAAASLLPDTGVLERGARDFGALHIMAKRGDASAVQWLLARGANPDQRWPHWDAEVTPLHLAAQQGHVDVARALLDARADATIRDSKHDGDPLDWAEFFGQVPVATLLRTARGRG